MNIYVYSSNDQIKQRFIEELSASEYSVQAFSSVEELTKALESVNLVNLIFHLSSEGSLDNKAESELEAVQTTFNKKVNTLVVTNTPEPEQGVRLLNLNVRGYANTFIEHDKLIMALAVIEQGEIWAGAALIQYMLSSSAELKHPEQESDGQKSIFKLLTDRELQIAQKILSGLQNKLIADELSISERTVKAHLSAIYKKIGVRNRLELTLKLQQSDRRERIERRVTS